MRALRFLVLSLLLFVRRADAQGLTDLNLTMIGPSSSDWPLYIAQQEGFFRQEGLNVNIILGGTPPNTTSIFASGGADIISNGTDSELAAISHQIPMKIIATMFVPMPYRLMTSPSITTWAQLKGKTIILATKQDVTAIFMHRLADAQHLDMNADFSIVLGGSSSVRYAALISGNVQGAVLSQPYDLLAETQGMHVLAQAADTIKAWLFDGIAVNPSWAAAHRSEVVRFLRALRKATDYGYTHEQQAVDIIIGITHVEPAIAHKAYALDFGTWRAFNRSGRVDPKWIGAVMDSVVGLGVIPRALPLDDVFDPSYAAEAAH
jgi:NitT/TauT family transport system substrate-binding protein